MPYRVERRPSCPPDRPYAVILESTNEVVACHASLEGARRQIKAIYATEQPTAKQQPTSSAVHVDTIIGEEERRRRLMKFAPQVLMKGDFVGHPFRGNQWVDASGVSRGVAGSSVGDADLGAGPALTDYVAAQSQGQPFAPLLELPPDVAAAVKKRDAILDKRAALGEEATQMFENHLATLDEFDAQTMRNDWSYRGTENKIRWAEKHDQGFADRVQENARALDEAFDYYENERRVMTNILVQAGMRQRTAAEMDAIREEMTDRSRTFAEEQAIEEARARDPLSLSYTEFEREGKGGRLGSRTKQAGVTSASYLDDEREIIGKLSFAPLLERGMTTQQIGELYDAARKSAEVMLRRPTAGLNMTTAALDRQQANDIKKIERFVEDAEVSVTVKTKNLTKILESERFKTQFETESSGGFLLPQARMYEEASRFGYPPDLNPVFRPVYGMVEAGGVKLPSQRGNQQYGSALVVLKDDVRARTTFTVGDSLSNINPSAPLLKPSAQPRVVGAYPLSGEKPPYLEAQVHGGVKASDIDRVVFESDGTAKTKPSATLLKKLDTLKIPYEIVAVAPNVEKHRLGATVLIKGDFVGHPFRGNQWVDASGASRVGGQSGEGLSASDYSLVERIPSRDEPYEERLEKGHEAMAQAADAALGIPATAARHPIKDAVDDYVVGDWKEVNAWARSVTDGDAPKEGYHAQQMLQTVEALDQATTRLSSDQLARASGLNEPSIPLFRGVTNIDDIKTGDTLRNRGFTSTSLSPLEAMWFSGSAGAQLGETSRPQPVLRINGWRTAYPIKGFEREMLLPRNTSLKVTGRTVLPYGDGGIEVIDCEVING